MILFAISKLMATRDSFTFTIRFPPLVLRTVTVPPILKPMFSKCFLVSGLPPILRMIFSTILKKPSIAETLDWAAALDALGIRELTPDALRQTAGFVLKNNEDLSLLEEMEQEENGGEKEHCGRCGGHHHD